MAKFEEVLQEATLDGVPFPLEERQIVGGFDYASFQYPGRPGQNTQDTGRKPRRFSLRIPMFDGMDPSWYPVGVENLLAVLTDTVASGVVEYNDPFLGLLDVKIAEWTLDEKARDRDGARISIILEDNDTDAVEFIARAVSDPSTQGIEAAEDLDSDLVDAGITEEDLDTSFASAGVPRTGIELGFTFPTIMSQSADRFFSQAESAIASIDELDREVERMTRRADAIASFSVADTARHWTIISNARLLAGACYDAADIRRNESAVKVKDFRVAGSVSLRVLLVDLYGDASRYDEVLSRNDIPNPNLILPGTVLRIPVR